jgi:hypothetical protein
MHCRLLATAAEDPDLWGKDATGPDAADALAEDVAQLEVSVRSPSSDKEAGGGKVHHVCLLA